MPSLDMPPKGVISLACEFPFAVFVRAGDLRLPSKLVVGAGFDVTQCLEIAHECYAALEWADGSPIGCMGQRQLIKLFDFRTCQLVTIELVARLQNFVFFIDGAHQ